MLHRYAIIAAGACAVALPARAEIIDFDALTTGDTVTNQFAAATFSSSAGNTNFVATSSLTHTPLNYICSGPVGGPFNCVEDTYVDFTNPVDRLMFWGTGVNDIGLVAQVNVYVGGAFDSTVDLIGVGAPLDPLLVDLTGFGNVTRIEIVNIVDTAGIGWDTFSFNIVPAPGMMGLFLLAGLTGRRRRRG